MFDDIKINNKIIYNETINNKKDKAFKKSIKMIDVEYFNRFLLQPKRTNKGDNN